VNANIFRFGVMSAKNTKLDNVSLFDTVAGSLSNRFAQIINLNIDCNKAHFIFESSYKGLEEKIQDYFGADFFNSPFKASKCEWYFGSKKVSALSISDAVCNAILRQSKLDPTGSVKFDSSFKKVFHTNNPTLSSNYVYITEAKKNH
jgi:hypothetical protein